MLRPVLLATAALMIAVGLGIWLILGETLVGIVIAAIGVFDLLTMRFVLGKVSRASAGSAPPAGEVPPAEPDPSYNPYARED
jgi:hypothetical protein